MKQPKLIILNDGRNGTEVILDGKRIEGIGSLTLNCPERGPGKKPAVDTLTVEIDICGFSRLNPGVEVKKEEGASLFGGAWDKRHDKE